MELSKDREAFALLMEMGTGKSKVAIDTITHLYKNGRIKAAVIVAPKGVYTNWTSMDAQAPGELAKHLPDAVMEETDILVWQSSVNKTVRERLIKFLEPSNRLKIAAINIEAISASPHARRFYQALLRNHKCLVIIDESTTIKNPSAKRTKFISKNAHHAAYRRILSGQPAPRSPLDIYSQFEFLDPNILGHKSFYTFRQRYAIMENANFGGRHVSVVVGYRNTPELHELIAPHSFRVLKKDCLDLPPQQYFFRDVEMTPEQHRVYDEMRHHALAGLGEKIVCPNCHGERLVINDVEMVCSHCGGSGHSYAGFASATAVITQILRLHQIVCGHLVDEDGITHKLPSNRPQALLDHIEESGAAKTAIWATYTYNIREITETLSKAHGPHSFVHFYGATTDEERELAKRRILNDPTCRFWVGNPATGRFGLTLANIADIVYYSNNHDLEHRDQSEQRTHRIGSEVHESVNYTDLIVRGTVEERIIRNLRDKINTAGVITGDAFREWLI